MKEVTNNLSEHFTLAEMCKTEVKLKNVPNEAQVENMKRLCGWLEMLRKRYNERYVANRRDPSATLGMTKGVLSSRAPPLLSSRAKSRDLSTRCAWSR